ncbi:MAG: transcriptional repressor [Paludibacteraceae bacterium]|nr:transcriptional repressor [Paludibacteraceae bacterium]MBR1995855.1 transcriptional repressor [Paludibacteraceae bacterium]
MPTKKEDILQSSSSRLCAYLDEHQLRHTPERFTILSTVCKLQRFTIDELRASLNELAISRATVYNTLSLLEDAQLVRRLTKEYGVRAAQYELVRATDSVVQIICQRCGRVGIVKDPTIKRMLADKRWSNFEPDHFSLYVVGQCKVCRRRSNKKS